MTMMKWNNKQDHFLISPKHGQKQDHCKLQNTKHPSCQIPVTAAAVPVTALALLPSVLDEIY